MLSQKYINIAIWRSFKIFAAIAGILTSKVFSLWVSIFKYIFYVLLNTFTDPKELSEIRKHLFQKNVKFTLANWILNFNICVYWKYVTNLLSPDSNSCYIEKLIGNDLIVLATCITTLGHATTSCIAESESFFFLTNILVQRIFSFDFKHV